MRSISLRTQTAAALVILAACLAWIVPARAEGARQDDILARGRYLATLAGCTTCHTPYRQEYRDPQQLSLEQIRILAFEENNAYDYNALMAGGRAFDLGPAGVVYTRNITPDSRTGIGSWSTEQIKTAIRTGQRPDGTMLFPIMPYHNFNSLADADLDAIVAFMGTISPVENEVPAGSAATGGLQPLPYRFGVTAPDPVDKAARGEYLVKTVMGCSDCHTPVDPQTGAPLMEMFLAGRQPYEGPWGIVYGGNITPDPETGLGGWSEEELKLAIIKGLNRDGRRLILMPWYAYAGLTAEDLDAVVYYMKEVLPPVSNRIPAPALEPEFVVVVEQAEETMLPASAIVLVVAGGVLFAALGLLLSRKKPA